MPLLLKGSEKMDLLWTFVKAFVVGGLICVLGQILIEKTHITSARILVLFVIVGVVVGAVGLYQPLVAFAGAGASVPLIGFGASLAKGAIEAVEEMGLLGAFIGGIRINAAGIAAAIFFGYLSAIIFTPKIKE